jgi:hypothetical protein
MKSQPGCVEPPGDVSASWRHEYSKNCKLTLFIFAVRIRTNYKTEMGFESMDLLYPNFFGPAVSVKKFANFIEKRL